MPVLLVLVFVGVPLLEIVVILQVGGAIGTWPTATLLIIDSVVGALLLRFEGRRAWSEFRRALGEGRWPGDEVAQGGLIIVGGTLLVTPGFVTDVVGFLLLLGPTRRLVARRVRRRIERGVTGGGATGDPSRRERRGPGPDRSGTADRGILEVEVVEIRREQPPAGPPTGVDRDVGQGVDGTIPERDDEP